MYTSSRAMQSARRRKRAKDCGACDHRRYHEPDYRSRLCFGFHRCRTQRSTSLRLLTARIAAQCSSSASLSARLRQKQSAFDTAYWVDGKLNHKVIRRIIMKKMFEDYFTEFQENMVSICLEYVEDKAEKTYIYRAYEENSIYGDHQDKRKPRDRRVVFFYTIMNTRQTGDHDL